MFDLSEAIRQTIELAQKNPSKFQMACILFNSKGDPISWAHNSTIKTHPWQGKLAKKVGFPERVFLHAEIAALIKAREDVHTLVVARVLKDGTPAMAKPCPVCQEAIRLSGVHAVAYTGKNGEIIMEVVDGR